MTSVHGELHKDALTDEGSTYQAALEALRTMAEGHRPSRTMPSSLMDLPIVEKGASAVAAQTVETKLFLAEARYRTLVEQLPVVTFLAALDGGVNELYVSPQIEALLGFSQKEWLEDPILWYTQLHPEDRERWHVDFARTCAFGERFRSEYRFLARDGRVVWVHGDAHMVRDEAGQPLFLQGMAYDITERKRAEEALQAVNAELESRVRERTAQLEQANGQLRQRAEQLAEMDQRKDEFLATLAHELRNPLAPIRNSLHILRMSHGNGPTSERVLEMMERQVSHMVRLVDNLIEVSRITRGKINLRKERVELAAILRNGVETSRPLIDAARHQLAIAVPPEPLNLKADSVRISQVIANLLNNAAKYTEEGGQIWLTARREGNDAVVSVRDTGLGISAEMLPCVFDMFAQVDRTLKRSQGGLGIGLTLARTLVEMHGGRIEARSGGPGQGSEFTVRLPLAQTDSPAIEGNPATSSRQLTGLCQQRILVVDDNRDVADSLLMLLQFLGADVYAVYDGPSALKALAVYRPSIVFLDIGMPGMDGHEVARQVRQMPEFREVVLIAMTGWGQEEDRRRSKATGFDHHLVKPVNADALQALLDSLPVKCVP
jgi:PAS domain S-box-containing protein